MGNMNIFNAVTPAFHILASNPDLSSTVNQLEVLERFVEVKVNEARKQLFSQKGQSMDGLLQLKLHLWNTP